MERQARHVQQPSTNESNTVMNKIILTTVALTATLLPLGPTAQAAPTTYPGMMCKSAIGVGITTLEGHHENDSMLTDYVVCPIVGDPEVESNTAHIWVIDNFVGLDVTCSARAKSLGDSVWFSSSSSTTFTGPAQLSFTPPTVNNEVAHRFFQCALPPTSGGNNSKVRTYRY